MSPRKKELKGIDDDTNSGNGSGIDDDDNDEEDGDDERSDDNEDQNSDENGPTPAPSSRTRSSVRREGDTKTSRKRKEGIRRNCGLQSVLPIDAFYTCQPAYLKHFVE